MNLYANDLKNWCIPYFLPKLKTAIDLVNQCPVHSGQALGAFGILDLHGLVLRNWQVPLETSFERHAREGVTEAHIAGFDFSLSAG